MAQFSEKKNRKRNSKRKDVRKSLSRTKSKRRKSSSSRKPSKKRRLKRKVSKRKYLRLDNELSIWNSINKLWNEMDPKLRSEKGKKYLNDKISELEEKKRIRDSKKFHRLQ